MQEYNKNGLTQKQLIYQMLAEDNTYLDIFQAVLTTKEWFPNGWTIAAWHISHFDKQYKAYLTPKTLTAYETIVEYVVNQEAIDGKFEEAASDIYEALNNSRINAFSYANILAVASAITNAYAEGYDFTDGYFYAQAFSTAILNSKLVLDSTVPMIKVAYGFANQHAGIFLTDLIGEPVENLIENCNNEHFNSLSV